MIDLKLLKTLQALQDTGSLQAAASRLFVTQSALSHQLKDIEQQLGQALFVRKSQPLQFSWQGKLLLELAEKILPQVTAVQQQLKSSQPLSQSMRLTVECHACFHWLLPAMKAFRSKWPQLPLQLAAEIEHHAIEALQSGELDLVLTTDQRLEQSISYAPLFELELMAFMAPEHPLANSHWLNPEQLMDATILTYPIPQERQDFFRYFMKKQRFTGQQRQVSQASQMLQLVAAGEGIAILPSWLAEPFLSQQLIQCKQLGPAGLKRTMYLASRREVPSQASQSLYQLLRQFSPV